MQPLVSRGEAHTDENTRPCVLRDERLYAGVQSNTSLRVSEHKQAHQKVSAPRVRVGAGQPIPSTMHHVGCGALTFRVSVV